MILIDRDQLVRVTQISDPSPMQLEKREQIAHLHISDPEVNHSRGWLAQHYPIRKIGIFGYDGQAIPQGVLPNLMIRPLIIQIEDMNEIAALPQTDTANSHRSGTVPFQATLESV
jgi:hypothetical protein